MKKTNLPPHWQIKRLGDVCKIYSGYGFPKNLQGQNDGKYPFYKVGDISRNVQKGHVYLNFCENYINEEIVDSLRMKLFPVNTVVFAKIGEALKLNRRAIMKEKGVVDNNAIGIKAREGFCEDKYLYYFMNTVKLEDYSRATTVPSVRKTDIEEIQIPIPPLPEQEQIVAKIEELFSELDAGIENIKTAHEQLKVYRQSLLKWAFEGKLTNEDDYSDWQIKKLGDVCKLNPKPSNPIDPELKIQFVPMKLVEEVVNKINLVETRKYCEVKKGSYTYFEDNDILFAKVTPCMENGKIAVAQNLKNGIGYGSSEFHVIRCSKDVLNKYIFYYVVQERFRKNAAAAMTGAVGLRRVPKSFLEESQIPIPPLPEQLKIVEELESRLTVCDNLEEDIKFSLARAESLRQSILKQAFEGKLLNFKGETDK